MTMPEGAQRSEDGNYWWDGSQWQPVQGTASSSASAAVGTRSADGHYSWDGTQWQPVGDQSHVSAAEGTSGGDQNLPMDWSQFPELGRLIHYGAEVDTYLTDLGVDPSKISDDEPMANA